jgi:hypothetical protein
MNRVALVALLLLLPLCARADTGSTNLTGEGILARVLANRATQDFSLKARLFVTRDRPVPVEILVKNTPEDTRTIYRSGDTELLVVQPVEGGSRLFLRGTGELTGAQQMNGLLGSRFAYYDLALPFLHWPNPKFAGIERFRGRDCYVVENKATGEPYARVQIYVDKQYPALLRVVAFDENRQPTKRLAITSFKRLGDVWVPRGMEAAFVPLGQTLPAEEKSRLEVYEGSYDAKLPAEWFSPKEFITGGASTGK